MQGNLNWMPGYMNMRNEVENNSGVISWTSKVKSLLELRGFPDLWLFPESVDVKSVCLFSKLD